MTSPGGAPHWLNTSAAIVAVHGVSSLGLATTALPIAIAGATFQVNRWNGKFHGVIVATTPSGWRSV